MAEVFESDIVEGRLLLLALANNANDYGICWPGSKSLGNSAGMSRSTVFRQIKTLERQGILLRRARKRKNGSLTSNVYVINRDMLRARKRATAEEERRELEAMLALVMEDTEDPMDDPADLDSEA